MPQQKVGDVVKLKSGPTVTITAVRPDGSYDWEPTKGAAWGAVESMTDTPVVGDVAQAALDIKEKGWGQALPSIGGLLGSLVGGKRTLPGIAGAAVGGGLGEVGRQALSDEPWSVGGVALEAAKQAGIDVMGRGLSGGLRKAAPSLYTSAAKGALIRKEYPGAIAQNIADAIPLTKGGVMKARGKIAESSQAADAILNQHPSPPVPGQEVVTAFRPVLDSLATRAKGGMDVSSDRAAVVDRMRRLMAQPPRSVNDATTIKREFQALSDSAMRREERGGQAQGVGDELNKATSRGYRAAIESRVPEVRAQNAITQNRIGGAELADAAVNREASNLKIGMRDLIGIGGGGALGYMSGNPALGIGAYVAARALSTPGTASRIAIGADRAARVPYAQLVRMLLLAQMAGDGAPAEGSPRMPFGGKE